MRRQDQGIRTQNQGSVRGSGSEVGEQDRGSWAVSLERIPELGDPGRRGLGTRPGDRGPGSSVGPGEGPCPRGPHPPGPRPAPSPPARPGPGLTAPTASCSSAPSRLSMMAARPGSRPGSGWRCGGGGGGGPAGGRRDPALEPRPCRRPGGAPSTGLAGSSRSPGGRPGELMTASDLAFRRPLE